MPIREDIARSKYISEEETDKIEEISKALTQAIDELINRGGEADA